MTDDQILAAAKQVDTPKGWIHLVHTREDGTEVPTFIAKQFAAAIAAQLAAPASEPVSHAARANVASQCLATASSDFSANVLVDAGKGTLRELLQDAAAAILAAPQGASK